MDGMLRVRIAVQEGCRAVPLHEHGGVPGPALHPDLIDLEVQVRKDASEALEPAPQCVTVVALSADRVCAQEPVMHVRRNGVDELIPPVVVDLIEALADPA